MATDRVIMKNTTTVYATISRLFLSDPFILAGNDDMHESSKEFEIWPYPTSDLGVSCP